MKGQRARLSAVLAIAVGTAMAAALVERVELIGPVQAQADDKEKRKEKRKERHRHKAAPTRTQPPPSLSRTPPRREAPTHPRAAPPPPPAAKARLRKPPPSQGEPVERFRRPPSAAESDRPRKRIIERASPPPGQERADPRFRKGQPPSVEKASPRGPVPKRLDDAHTAPRFRKGQPPSFEKAPPRGPVLKRFEEVRKARRERIIKQGNQVIVRHDEAERFLRRPGAKSNRRPDGSVEVFYVRRDGVRVVTVVDARGRLLWRYRRTRDGRVRSIIDNRRFHRDRRVGIGVVIALPPPRVLIPHEEYIVDYESASDDDLFEALHAPPIEDLDRAYSLDEVRDNYALRARTRSIELDTVTFESGSWEIPPDQYGKLERMARAILRVLDDNPEAVVLVEGHTDAVGPDDENASLADRRAEAVAEVLSDTFDVPPENLVTQGYGEQYLRIDTQGPEPRNRRVTIRNIAGLMAER